MTAEELAALPPDALIYLPSPSGWDVTAWRPGGMVTGGNWYTLLYPPEADGVVRNRKPVYIETVQLLDATTDEAEAWETCLNTLMQRVGWINLFKLNDTND